MTILPLIAIVMSAAFTGIGFYCWRKYQYRNFLFASVFGIVSVVISIWGYFHRGFIGLSLILITLYLAILCWNLWKKFQEKKFLHTSILCLVMIFITIYGFYIAEVDFSLPIAEWPISSFLIAGSLVAAIIILLLL